MTKSATLQDGSWLQDKQTDASKVDGQKPGRRQPNWNTSTTMLQLVRDSLVSQRWGNETAPNILRQENSDSLPQRPLDLGVGLWR